MHIDDIKEKFPFLTGIKLCDTEDLIVLVQNMDDKFITFYDINSLKTTEEQKELISLADEWWWESNRIIPPNLFIGDRIKKFKYVLKSFSLKETEIIFGPTVSLNNLLSKKIKRKQIQFIRT